MSDKQYSSGINFTGLLAIVFITLKLCGVIQWSWWWVLSPLWVPVVIALGCVAAALLLTAIASIIAYYKNE